MIGNLILEVPDVPDDLLAIDDFDDQRYWASLNATIDPVGRGDENQVARWAPCQVLWWVKHPGWPARAAAARLLAERHAGYLKANIAVAVATHDAVDGITFTDLKVLTQ